MTFRGRSIWKLNPPGSGIRIGNPAVEEGLAARWGGYRIEEFALLDPDTRTFVMALRRTEMQIDAVIAHDQLKARQAAATRPRRGKLP